MKQVRKLSEICNIFSGSRPKGGAISSGVLSIGGEHISSDGYFDLSNPKYIPEGYFKNLKRGILKPGDVLLVKDGATTGKVGFFGNEAPFAEGAVNEHVFVLRANDFEIIKPKYICYFLKSETGNNAILKRKVGSAQGGINLSIGDIGVVLPTLSEQQEIVSILEEIDDLRQKQRKAIELTRQMIPALFYEMFGDIHNPICKLTTLAEAVLISGKKMNPQDQLTSTFYYIGLENIESGTGKVVGSTLHTGSGIKSLKNVFGVGDVLYGKLRPYLNKVCLPGSQGICSTDILVLKPRNLICTPEFLCATLQNSYFVEQASAQMQGANLPRISAESLLQIPIILPPFSHQQQFTLKFTEIHSLIAQQEQSIQKLDVLFETTLNQFFS